MARGWRRGLYPRHEYKRLSSGRDVSAVSGVGNHRKLYLKTNLIRPGARTHGLSIALRLSATFGIYYLS